MQTTTNKETNKQMNNIKKALLVSLVPIIAPLPAIAEAPAYKEDVNVLPGAQGHSKSWRASQVIGVNVKNATDEVIGDVKDIVIDMTSGEVLAVIISTGGFLGIGESLSAVPVSVLRYDDRAEGFKTKLTKQQLENAPQFKTNAWPDYNESESQEELRKYRDSVQGEATATRSQTRRDTDAVDREARNNAANAGQQGNSPQDLKITRDIRSDVMATDMSMGAKNIRIITRDEMITLNGEVETKAEHQQIMRIANSHSNGNDVTDNLTVKSK
jgi:sporulation protein YlmC with PRC-barrel domain